MRALQDPAGAVETSEQRRAPPALDRGGQALPRGDRPGAFGEAFGAEQLAADRSSQQVFAGVCAACEETAEPAGRSERIDGRTSGAVSRYVIAE